MDFPTTWLNELLSSFDGQLGDEQQHAVFGRCSQSCTIPWATKAVGLRRELPPGTDTASLLRALCEVLPGGGPEIHVEGTRIAWSFAPEQCPCPVGQATKNPTVCLCGREHVRGMVEALLGKPVAVTLEQSLLRGGDRCAYTIEVLEP